MDNNQFNKVLEDAFKKYLETGSRSNEKLKILHGKMAEDLANRLGHNYTVKSLGFQKGKEAKIDGRYVPKTTDISIFKGKECLGGIAVKYIMRNYSQNSVNYFENMLGETANIRCNGKAYFHIVVVPKHVPYFKSDKTISKIETLTQHNLDKYIKLSNDDADVYMHTPNKTLLYIINTPDIDKDQITNEQEYIEYLKNIDDLNFTICNDNIQFNNSIIYNDYDNFINKVVNYINYLS